MAKRISNNPDWIKADHVKDLFSVSGCISHEFADYISHWKHNGYWFFDSPEVIKALANSESISVAGTTIFYYEVYEKQYADGWSTFEPEESIKTNVIEPKEKHLEGFDVVTFSGGASPECSPLSCCALASELSTNEHCLLRTFDEAKRHL